MNTLDQCSHRASALDVLAGWRDEARIMRLAASIKQKCVEDPKQGRNPRLQNMGRQSVSVDARHVEKQSQFWNNHEHKCERFIAKWTKTQAVDESLIGQIPSAFLVGRSCGDTEILGNGKSWLFHQLESPVHVSFSQLSQCVYLQSFLDESSERNKPTRA